MSTTSSSPADTYESTFEPFLLQFGRLAIAAAALKRGERVLDVGAGTGGLALEAALTHGVRVSAIDLFPPFVARINERWATVGASAGRGSGSGSSGSGSGSGSGGGVGDGDGDGEVTAQVMNGQELTFGDSSFDVVFSVFAVVLFPDTPKGLSEIARVLSSTTGRAIVVSWPVVSGTFLRFFNEALVEDYGYSTQWKIGSCHSEEELKGALLTAGFDQVEVETVTQRATVQTVEEYIASGRVNPIVRAKVAEVLGTGEPAPFEAFLEKAGARLSAGATVNEADGSLSFDVNAFLAVARKLQ